MSKAATSKSYHRAGLRGPWRRALMFSFVLGLSGLLSPQFLHAAPPKIVADPPIIKAGQSCLLTWSSDGEDAYILNYGRVNANGSVAVTPSKSTRYVLVVQGKTGVLASTIGVQVKDQRGFELPNLDAFKFSVIGKEQTVPYTDFLGVVENVIRTNHFQPIGTFLPSESYVVYYTDHLERDDLRGQNERGRNAHRLTYSVEIEQPSAEAPHEVKFNVKALVEYRPIAESDWYPSDDSELSTKCAEDLKSQIAAVVERPTK